MRATPGIAKAVLVWLLSNQVDAAEVRDAAAVEMWPELRTIDGELVSAWQVRLPEGKLTHASYLEACHQRGMRPACEGDPYSCPAASFQCQGLEVEQDFCGAPGEGLRRLLHGSAPKDSLTGFTPHYLTDREGYMCTDTSTPQPGNLIDLLFGIQHSDESTGKCLVNGDYTKAEKAVREMPSAPKFTTCLLPVQPGPVWNVFGGSCVSKGACTTFPKSSSAEVVSCEMQVMHNGVLNLSLPESAGFAQVEVREEKFDFPPGSSSSSSSSSVVVVDVEKGDRVVWTLQSGKSSDSEPKLCLQRPGERYPAERIADLEQENSILKHKEEKESIQIQGMLLFVAVVMLLMTIALWLTTFNMVWRRSLLMQRFFPLRPEPRGGAYSVPLLNNANDLESNISFNVNDRHSTTSTTSLSSQSFNQGRSGFIQVREYAGDTEDRTPRKIVEISWKGTQQAVVGTISEVKGTGLLIQLRAQASNVLLCEETYNFEDAGIWTMIPPCDNIFVCSTFNDTSLLKVTLREVASRFQICQQYSLSNPGSVVMAEEGSDEGLAVVQDLESSFLGFTMPLSNATQEAQPAVERDLETGDVEAAISPKKNICGSQTCSRSRSQSPSYSSAARSLGGLAQPELDDENHLSSSVDSSRDSVGATLARMACELPHSDVSSCITEDDRSQDFQHQQHHHQHQEQQPQEGHNNNNNNSVLGGASLETGVPSSTDAVTSDVHLGSSPRGSEAGQSAVAPSEQSWDFVQPGHDQRA